MQLQIGKRYSGTWALDGGGAGDKLLVRRTHFRARSTSCRPIPTNYYNRLMRHAVALQRQAVPTPDVLAWHVWGLLIYKGPQQADEFRRLSLPVEPSNCLFCDIRRTVATPRRCAYFYSPRCRLWHCSARHRPPRASHALRTAAARDCATDSAPTAHRRLRALGTNDERQRGRTLHWRPAGARSRLARLHDHGRRLAPAGLRDVLGGRACHRPLGWAGRPT